LTDAKRALNPNVVKAVLAENGRCLYFSRSDVPFRRSASRLTAWEHLGIYAYRRAALRRFVALAPSALEKAEKLEQLRALEDGMRVQAVVVAERPLAVDVPADLRRAENFLRRGHP